MLRAQESINVKTEKKNRIIVEEIKPDEIRELWKKLPELDKIF